MLEEHFPPNLVVCRGDVQIYVVARDGRPGQFTMYMTNTTLPGRPILLHEDMPEGFKFQGGDWYSDPALLRVGSRLLATMADAWQRIADKQPPVRPVPINPPAWVVVWDVAGWSKFCAERNLREDFHELPSFPFLAAITAAFSDFPKLDHSVVSFVTVADAVSVLQHAEGKPAV